MANSDAHARKSAPGLHDVTADRQSGDQSKNSPITQSLVPTKADNRIAFSLPKTSLDKKQIAVIDCGSVKLTIDATLPIELYFELDESVNDFPDHQQVFSAVHCLIPGVPGECIISAFAVPTNDDAWTHVLRTMARSLRAQGIVTDLFNSNLGGYLVADYGSYRIVVLGYLADRSIVRCTVFIPQERIKDTGNSAHLFRKDSASARGYHRGSSLVYDWHKIAHEILTHCIVVRGSVPMPAYSYLPLSLPEGAPVTVHNFSHTENVAEGFFDDTKVLAHLALGTYHRGIPTRGSTIGLLSDIRE